MPGERGRLLFVIGFGISPHFIRGGVERGSGEGASFISRLVCDFIIIFFVFSPSFKRYIYI